MSRTPSDQLHKLICSLSPAEIRYFKIFSSRHYEAKDTNYVKLFDVIAAQKEYEEAKILERFRKEKFTRHFSIAKARLYGSILRALDIFHSDSSIDAGLKREIHYAEILYKKSLYGQCARVLSSAKKAAVKYERHSTLQEIYLWEKKLIEKDNYSDKTEKDFNDFLEEDRMIGEKIKNFSDLWNIKSQLFMILNKQGKARTKEDLQRFKKIIDHPLMESESKALSTETKYLFHHVHSAYCFGIGDYRKCYEHLKKNVALIESRTHLFEEEPNIYFFVLTNTINISGQLKLYDEAFRYLKKLREVPQVFDISKNEDLEIRLFSSTLSTELTLYNAMGNFEKAMETIPAIEDGLERYSGKINKLRVADFYINIAVACFGAEKFSQSLRWNNRILNDKSIEQHQNIHCISKIFNLIVHIELKNESLIPYTYRSTYRYLARRRRKYRFESVFLKFVEQLMKQKKRTADQYRPLWNELKTLEKDPLEQPAFEFFDFAAWAQSKAENRYFRDVVEAKAKHQ